MSRLTVALILAASLAAASNSSFASDPEISNRSSWRVVNLSWKQAPASLGAGDLALTITNDKNRSSDRLYIFAVEVNFKKKVTALHVSGCSIVSNIDTEGGSAGALMLDDGHHALLYLKTSETFLVTPRVCVSVMD